MSSWLASVTSSIATPYWTAAGVIGFALVAFFLGHRYYRRWMTETPQVGGFPWTLEDLRALRERGDITEPEYQALRGNLIGFAGSSERMPASASTGVASRPVAGFSKNDLDRAVSPDPSGETVWRFDLKKSPPG